VLTHHPHDPIPMEGGTTFHFVTEGFDAAYAAALEAAGDQGVDIAGGASTVRQALLAGVIDEFTLDIAPVLLGDGERLFDGLRDLALEITEVIHSPRATHVGYRVPQLDMGDLTEVFRLRAVLEDEVLRDAVVHTTGTNVECLRAQIVGMTTSADAGDVAAAATTNRRFHQLVVQPSRMARTKRILTQLWNVTEAYRPSYLRLDLDRIQRRHNDWVDALGTQDVNNVLALNNAHRARTFAYLSDLVDA